MKWHFFKYQGTGNDFVIIDNRLQVFSKNDTKLIAQMCDRKFGIGADGLILLENTQEADFKMVYYNADGNESTMCGNGGRCIVHFAAYLGIIKDTTTFLAVDGLHTAKINQDQIALQMIDVSIIETKNEAIFVNTGSPHHVEIVTNVERTNVFERGRNIRNEWYGTAGANVNFVSPVCENTFNVRTYERGVEDETLSCGTGVTAVAIAMHYLKKATANTITLKTPGGELKVTFDTNEGVYKNVFLIGPAQLVFKGTWQ